jgi:presenilin 1
MTDTIMANGDGNCLPTHHERSSRNGGFQRVEQNYYYDDDSDDEVDSNSEEALSLNELMYSAHSFHVMVMPVSITMILAALTVTYINTPQTLQEGAKVMNEAYHVWQVDIENDSTSKQLVADFVNGLAMVTVIGAMTFGIVLLYKYRCMKVLIGYMMFSSMTLLGVLGGAMFNVMIEKYQIPIDWLTFIFGLYNFAFVGVAAIFYSLGIPPYITQGYLICSSVIVAWQLSHFDTISSFTLLIMLGLYDLCAVLTPCGPLRALVNLMSDEDAPEMPGLLYEAEIPEGLKRPVMGGRSSNNEEQSNAGQSAPASASEESYHQQPSVSSSESADSEHEPVSNSESGGDVEMSDRNNNRNEEQQQQSSNDQLDNAHLGPAPTTKIPFGLAKLYRLKLTSPPSFVTASRRRRSSHRSDIQPGNISTDPLLSPTNEAVESDSTSSHPSDDNGALDSPFVIDPDVEYTPKQFNTIVEAILPRNGAKIVRQPRHTMEAGKPPRYGVFGSDGTLKRILFIRDGKAYEESMDDDDDDSEDGRYSNTIKLGLGDFIFYSVLVAKSAQYSFTCFTSSFLVILAGLGGTLVLLAVYKHALPALPISIFLAVAFYLLTRFCIEPWIHALMTTPFYV